MAEDGYPANPGDGRPPMLGVNMSPVPISVQRDENLHPDDGVYVRRVYEGTTANNIGINRGDVITSINGNPINSMTDVRDNIFGSTVGDDIAVTVIRDGQEVTLGGNLGSWPEEIPQTDINAEAERRFRDMQKRRLANEAQQAEQDLAHAQRQRAALGDSVNRPEDRELGLTPDASALDRAIARDEGRMAYRAIPHVSLPANLSLLLPSFELRVRAGGGSHLLDELPAPADPPTPTIFSHMAPQLSLSYRFTVDSEAL